MPGNTPDGASFVGNQPTNQAGTVGTDAFQDLGPAFQTLVLADGLTAQEILFPAEVQQKFSVNQTPGEAISLTFRLRRRNSSGAIIQSSGNPVSAAVSSAVTQALAAIGVSSAPSVVTPAGVSFVFSLNPQRLDTTKTKVYQYVLTNGGWLIQTWGNNYIDFSLSSKTDNLSPEIEALERPAGSPQLGIYATKAYKFFKLLEFYFDYFNGGNEGKQGNRLLSIGAPADTTLTLGRWGGSYDGILYGFKYMLDADDPFRIAYTLDFRAYPKLVGPSLL